MAIGQNYIPKLIPSLNHIKKGSRNLLLHPEKPFALTMNATGTEIFQLCNGKNNVAMIAKNIASKYQQPYLKIYKDVASFIEKLKDLQMIVTAKRSKKNEVPLPEIQGIHLNLTNLCNLRCIHCAVTDNIGAAELDTKRIIRLIDELVNNGGKSISITGGEPLLRADCLSILAYAALKLKTTLLTNAVSITPDTARVIVDMGITVQISLDGSKPEIHDAIRGKGTFRKTMKGIELLKNAGIGERLCLRVTLMKNNVGNWKKILEMAKKKGIQQIRLATVERLGRAKGAWRKLALTDADHAFLFGEILNSYSKSGKKIFPQITWGCSGLNLNPVTNGINCNIGRTITIDASGDIFPCTMMIHPAFRLGNINRMNLKDISKSKKLKILYHACFYRKDTITKCKSCAWRNFCQAGCPASAYANTGSLNLTDNLCRLRNKFYREVLLGSK